VVSLPLRLGAVATGISQGDNGGAGIWGRGGGWGIKNASCGRQKDWWMGTAEKVGGGTRIPGLVREHRADKANDILGIAHALRGVGWKPEEFLERFLLYYWLNYLFTVSIGYLPLWLMLSINPGVRGLTLVSEYLETSAWHFGTVLYRRLRGLHCWKGNLRVSTAAVAKFSYPSLYLKNNTYLQQQDNKKPSDNHFSDIPLGEF